MEYNTSPWALNVTTRRIMNYRGYYWLSYCYRNLINTFQQHYGINDLNCSPFKQASSLLCFMTKYRYTLHVAFCNCFHWKHVASVQFCLILDDTTLNLKAFFIVEDTLKESSRLGWVGQDFPRTLYSQLQQSFEEFEEHFCIFFHKKQSRYE